MRILIFFRDFENYEFLRHFENDEFLRHFENYKLLRYFELPEQFEKLRILGDNINLTFLGEIVEIVLKTYF